MNLTRMSVTTTNPLYIHNRRYKHNEFLDEIAEMFNDDIAQRVLRGVTKCASTEPGWRDLIIELNESLRDIDPDYRIDRIKEKFGGLRYYVEFSDECSGKDVEMMWKLIDVAEAASTETCMDCGAVGETYNASRVSDSGWYRTACESCRT